MRDELGGELNTHADDTHRHIGTIRHANLERVGALEPRLRRVAHDHGVAGHYLRGAFELCGAVGGASTDGPEQAGRVVICGREGDAICGINVGAVLCDSEGWGVRRYGERSEL